MNKKQTHFQPNTIDTQLDELTKVVPLPGADPEVKTVQAVQQVYKNLTSQEAASLDRVFNRFIQHVARKDELTEDQQENISTQTMQLKSNLLDVSANAGRIQENYMLIQKQNYSTIRRMGMAIAAVLALALVAGSIVSFLLIANARLAHDPQRPTTNLTVVPQFYTSTPIPQPQTTCPAAGTSRVAILPALTQKVGQSIVYTSTEINNQSNVIHWGQAHLLERYDVASGQTTSLQALDSSNASADLAYIQEANLSANGQWIVLVITPQNTQSSVPDMIQLLRVDGQYRQTLYCGPTGQFIKHAHLSPDMKSLVFSMAPPSASSSTVTGMYRLDLINGGSVHTLLTQQPEVEMGLIYEPETWIDNNHVLVNMFVPFSAQDVQGVHNDAPGKLMSLDITQGDNQQIAQLPVLLDQMNTCQKFDVSPDRSLLVFTQCQGDNNAGGSFTDTLMLKNITNGTTQTLWSRDNLSIQSVYMVSNTTILFNVLGPNHSGLWRVNSDGTGLTELVSVSTGIPPSIDPQQIGYEYGKPSTYISDDRSQYIVIEEGQAASLDGPLIQLNYMPSSGGNLVMVRPLQNQQIISVLGWTTY